MKQRVKKRGNAHVITIPRKVMDALKWAHGTEVRLVHVGNKLEIHPVLPEKDPYAEFEKVWEAIDDLRKKILPPDDL